MKKKIVLVLPVYNEERVLSKSVETLCSYFSKNMRDYQWTILIANNASKDRTKEVADELCRKHREVKALHLTFKGRGNALKHAWKSEKADAYGYCDIDLATDISHLRELFDSVLKEKYDISIGNRYLPLANTRRTWNRLIYSKIYIWLVLAFFRTKLTDFQCGFKAVSKKVVDGLILEVKDNEWFFDSELLIRAESSGLKIKQIPVKWNENPKDSKVNIIKTGYQYIKNLILLKGRI